MRNITLLFTLVLVMLCFKVETYAQCAPDITPPVLTCPADVNANNEAGFCGKVVTFVDPVGVDFCGASTTVMTAGLASGSTFPVGVTTQTYEATDGSGNTSTCSFTITIVDAEDPIISCPANITQNNANNQCGRTVIFTTPVGTDNCVTATTVRTAGQASGTFFPIGTTTETYQVTDGVGRTASCTFTITIVDAQSPSITCPSNITQNNDAGNCDAVVTYVAPVGTDNCPGASTALTAGSVSGSTFNVGANTVTYTVTDGVGLTTSCSFTITVVDAEDPQITCPANISASSTVGFCGRVVNFVEPTGTDNCVAGLATARTDGLAPGATFPVGTTTQTYVTTDGAGNAATCSFTVTIIDNEAPVLTCPANVSTTNTATVCGKTVTFTTPVGTDNCAGVSTVRTTGQASGTFFPVGTTTETYVSTDAAGNTTTCSFTITVLDTENPAITCPANISQNADVGVCGGVVTFVAPVGTDNCTGSSTARTAGQASGTTFPVGTTTQTYVVTDASGNTATCSFTVTIIDNVNPAITCPANISQNNDAGNCDAVVTFVAPVGTDNCAGSSTVLTAGLASGSTFPVGVTTNTYTVTDGSGNTAACSFTVTAVDNEDPLITCPANITQANDAGNCDAVVTFIAPVGTDNCAGQSTALTAGSASGATFPVGTTTETYVVTDAAGNTATCSFTITVQDNENPQITCPANITQNNDVGNCSAVVTFVAPVGTDNCAGASTVLTAGSASGATFAVGTTTETYVVTDAAGNTATCSFTITVNDTQNPSITCPANITQGNDNGGCGAVVTFVAPVGTDNCAGASTSQTAGFASGAIYPVGTTTQTFVVTDAVGNTATCSFTITVNDTENPTITCPSNITLTAPDGFCAEVATFVAPVGLDNCLGQSTALTAGSPSGSSFNVGVTTETYTVTDAAGNTASCSFTITILDAEDPQITCPANISQNNDAGICGAVVTYVAPVGTDNCAGQSTALTAGSASGATFSVGTTTNTYTVTDASGNTASCSFTVTVIDNEAPQITCPANITQNSGASCSATVVFVAPVGTDNCAGASTVRTAGQASGTSFPLGVTTQTYVVTDAVGLTATCSFTITVVDNTNPTITCPSNITQNSDPLLCGRVVAYTAPVGTDNCAGASTALTAGSASGATFPVGTTTNTYTVTDGGGNTASCSFTVTIIDNVNPQITCPANITQSADVGACNAVVTFVAPVGTDNCPGSSTALTAGSASGATFPMGSTTETYTVTDAYGNTATCSFTITIVDLVPPTITCPANITANNTVGFCSTPVVFVAPVGTDNCAGVSTVRTSGQASGTNFPVGTTTQTYTSTDASGNTSSCTFTITVLDVQNPTIVCPGNVTTNATAGTCARTVNYLTPVGTDNCSGASTVLTAGQASGTSFSVGTTTNTYVVTDASGNTATCSFTVTVIDNVNPTITCPSNITQNNDAGICGAVVTFVAPVGADNCSGSSTVLTAGSASGATFSVGATTETYTVTDASGNTATCSFTITVVDAEDPTIVCPANITQANDAATCGAVVTFVAPVGIDNCAGASTAMTAGQLTGSTYSVGTTTQTYVVTDGAGNSATCSFTITVLDNELPVIACPANISTNAAVGFCSATVNFVAPVGTDNCPGAVTVKTTGLNSGSAFPVGVTNQTYTVTDPSGNTASCSFTVTVIDTQNPTITCPANITQNNTAGLCGRVVTYTAPVGLDNCSGSSTVLTAGQASNTLFPVGATVNTYTVTDASGNTASCSFTVTIIDAENPTIACPANITQNNDLDECTAIVTYATPVGVDNCPTATTVLTAGLANGSQFPLGTTTNTFTVTDGAGLTATCSFTVTVVDAQDPEITCPSDITQSSDLGVCTAMVVYPAPLATDNCPGYSTAMNAGMASGSNFPVGVTTNTYTVTDGAGNTATCSFNVTVTDNIDPVIVCPANITQNNDAGVCGATITFVAPVGTDNCSGASTVLTAGQASNTVFPIGTTTNTYTVTDASGNTASCSFDVTINDSELPVIACPANITQNNDAGDCGADITYATPVGTDNCPASVTSLTAGLASGSNFPIGTTTNTFVVTDASGNTATCSFTVTINDTENPTISCPADITQDNDLDDCGAIVTFVTPVGLDNCAGAVTVRTAGQASGTQFPIGTTLQTYVVTDASGNTATCSFNITVNDVQDPTITCPSDIFGFADPGTCGTVINFISPMINDNCPASVLTQTAGQASGATYQVGVNTNTYLVTDASGNTATCSFNITIADTEDPTIVCPANITQNNDLGDCGAVVNYVAPVGVDNCSGAVTTLTAGIGTGLFFPLGTTTESYLVTDAGGLTATCSFTVTIVDAENPVVVCPANITQNNDAGMCDAVVTYVAPVGTDNCPGATTALTAGPASGATFPVGTTNITYTVTDAGALTGTCTFTVTVVDAENPTITCPADLTVNNDAGMCDAVVTFVDPIGTDNCPVATTVLTVGLPSGSTFPLGTTTQTYVVTDGVGLTATCSYDITVIDAENPVIVCPADITVNNDAGMCDAVVTYVAPVGTDNCPGVTTAMTAGMVSGSTYPVGTTIHTFTSTDGAGNTASCSFNITVNDTELPVITCPADITLNNDLGVCGAVATYVAPIGTDNCPSPITVQTAGQASGATFGVGVNVQTYTVTDASGNTATCSFNITVNDTENPTIVCPSNMTVNNDAGICGATVDFPAPVTTDNCPSEVVTVTGGLADGALFPIGTTTETLTVTDASGNTATCTFDVTVVDAEAPVINCPADITANADAGTCATTVTFVDPVGTDNCPGGTTTVMTAGQASGTSFNVGTTTQTYTVTDPVGNASTCSFDVIVLDVEDPVIVCPADISVNNDAGICGAVVTFVDPVGIDNCSGVTTAMTAGQASGTTFPGGVTIQTFTATDAYGNTASCSFNVTVTDNEAPVITCPVDLTVNNDAGMCDAVVTFADPVGTDNCPGVTTTMTAGLPSGSTFPMGTTTLTYVTTDAVGLTATCSYDITVIDAENPVINCPADVTVNNDAGMCDAVVTFVDPIGTDNCPGVTTVMTAGMISGSTYPVGTTTQTFTVTDAVGLTATCSFDVIVVDAELPVIVCPADIAVNNDAGVCGAVVTFVDPVGTDNCVGATTSMTAGQAAGTTFAVGTTVQTFTVTDAAGNTATCSFNIAVTDAEAPVAPVLADTTVECIAVPPTTTDNCSGIITGTTTDVLTEGQTVVVTWTFDDGNGNISTSTQNITVDDVTAPVTPTLADVTGECSATVTATPTANDNCAGVITGTTTDPLTYNTQGTHVITWSFDDGNGNISTTTQNVVIQDVTDPTITAPATVTTVPNNAGCTAIVADLGTPVTADNCSVVSVTNDAPAAFPVGNTTVTWTVTDIGGNTTTATQTVTVLPLTSTISEAECVTYTAPDGQVYTSSGVYTAVIPGSYGCDSTITINLTILEPTTSTIDERHCETYTAPDGQTYTTSGTYTAVIANAAGCDSTITINLIIDTMPAPMSVTTTDNKVLTADGVGYQYEWISCDGQSSWISGGLAQSFEPIKSGSYAVIVTNNTCVDTSDCVTIELKVQVPQVISPNGDGVNDKLVIDGIYDYPNNVLRIYNRWGSLVYEQGGYQNDWDGKNLESFSIGGKDLPVGTYFYVLDLGVEGLTVGENTYKGYIYLTK